MQNLPKFGMATLDEGPLLGVSADDEKPGVWMGPT